MLISIYICDVGNKPKRNMKSKAYVAKKNMNPHSQNYGLSDVSTNPDPTTCKSCFDLFLIT